jgi:hypothetical protein
METNNLKSGVFSSPSREKMARNGMAYEKFRTQYGENKYGENTSLAIIRAIRRKINLTSEETTEIW